MDSTYIISFINQQSPMEQLCVKETGFGGEEGGIMVSEVKWTWV